MKPTSFVSTVGEISAEEVVGVPDLDAVISYWTDNGYTAEEWFHELNDDWGPAGFAVRRGGEVQGFVVYAPPQRLAGADRYPLGPIDEDAVLLAYVGGDARTRRRLLVRMLRDLRHRGVGSVQAIASDRGVSNHVPTPFLLQSGWRPVRRAP